MFDIPFAILEQEREPLQFGQFKALLSTWLQTAGGFAAIGLLVFLVAVLLASSKRFARTRPMPVIILLGALSATAYGAALVFHLVNPGTPVAEVKNPDPNAPKPPAPPPTTQEIWRDRALTIGGGLSLVGLLLHFLTELLKLSPQRIWAIARLSFIEAIRRKVLWVFVALLLVPLFPPKWFFEVKPEDEVRSSIAIIEFVMYVLMMVAFSLLAAMSIPGDIKSQTIHTIVTKPVERFEIVLGRFIGFVGIATIVLVFLRACALVLILASNIAPAARAESFQARDPVYADMEFRNSRGTFEGESVGREWEYRKYIAGGANTKQRAAFVFRELPTSMAGLEQVPCEFAFDIFRTTKGEENKGVSVSLFCATPKWSEQRKDSYDAEVKKLNLIPARMPNPGDASFAEVMAKWNKIAEDFGYFEFKGKEIADYHTFRVAIPGGLFRPGAFGGKPGDPPVTIAVKCESRTQFLGVAKRDLYLLAGNYSFAWNFMKGAFGLWLMLCLVIGISVVLSTYLPGIIAWLICMMIALMGYFRDYVAELAGGNLLGGGPAESFLRLANNTNLLNPLEETPAKKLADVYDSGYKYVAKVLYNLLPDVERFDWSKHVAEGFNVPGGEMAMTFLVLCGYLLPWAVLGFYLMKSREIAN